ncbi:hypothetical protein AX17_003098 [Amanita inopinata Kibby_2008]|nr:hypothetical protein AX17_003098 [Amanita inopinata Kibby_2008]
MVMYAQDVYQDVSETFPPKFIFKTAPEMGPVQSSMLTTETKILTSIVKKKLQQVSDKADSFEDIQSVFNSDLQIIVKLKQIDNKTVKKMICTRGSSIFDFFNDPSIKTITAVRYWIARSLVTDPQILRVTGLDNPDTIGDFITISARNIKHYASMLAWDRAEGEDVADIAVIQYPTAESPYIKLHHVQLSVWLKELAMPGGIIKEEETGLLGRFETFVYEPVKTNISSLAKSTKEQALEDFHRSVVRDSIGRGTQMSPSKRVKPEPEVDSETEWDILADEHPRAPVGYTRLPSHPPEVQHVEEDRHAWAAQPDFGKKKHASPRTASFPATIQGIISHVSTGIKFPSTYHRPNSECVPLQHAANHDTSIDAHSLPPLSVVSRRRR